MWTSRPQSRKDGTTIEQRVRLGIKLTYGAECRNVSRPLTLSLVVWRSTSAVMPCSSTPRSERFTAAPTLRSQRALIEGRVRTRSPEFRPGATGPSIERLHVCERISQGSNSTRLRGSLSEHRHSNLDRTSYQDRSAPLRDAIGGGSVSMSATSALTIQRQLMRRSSCSTTQSYAGPWSASRSA